ncbi:MAG: cytochrome c4 [Rhodocyclaceae bacterium]|nr:MAG: cytochrome c4 [Rhodocyclaceae bacterium]
MKFHKAVVAVLVASSFSAGAQVSSSEEAAGKALAASVCASCHGADGNSVDPTVPKLAGLQERYLVKQFKDYIAGKRKNDTATACGPDLKPADIAGLAAWFSNQKPAPGKAGDPALIAEGKKIYDQGIGAKGVDDCLQCHEAGGKGSGLYPKVSGQHAAYTFKQMRAFTTHARRNDKNDQMHDVAEKMSEQEIRMVAEYLMGL